jgi:hypothetical protein
MRTLTRPQCQSKVQVAQGAKPYCGQCGFAGGKATVIAGNVAAKKGSQPQRPPTKMPHSKRQGQSKTGGRKLRKTAFIIAGVALGLFVLLAVG